MSAESELADFVMNHLGRGTPLDPAVGAMVIGLADIVNAFSDAQEARGNWGGMLAKLRTGTENVGVAIGLLRGQAAFSGLVAFAERQHRFAMLLIDEIVRLQAGEST